MELYNHLLKREEEGKPIRTGLVGCGQMGSGLVHVTRKMKGLETFAISDIDVRRPKLVLEKLGIDESQICITNKRSEPGRVLRRRGVVGQ